MENRDTPPHYYVYAHLGEVQPHRLDGPATWRFSLENPGSGYRHGGGDLESPVAFPQREQREMERQDQGVPAATRPL